MDAPQTPRLSRRVPWLTLLMVGAAVAVAVVPRSSPWLVYDRSAILSGQIWRMFTGHWVHFSTRHLICDVTALGIAGWIIEDRGLPRFGWFCLLAPWFISAAALVFEPQMQYCGGLSALAIAAITLLGLNGLSEAPPWRWVCVAALIGIAGKTLFEMTTSRSLFGALDGVPVIVSVSNHVAAVAFALAFYGQSKLSPRGRTS